MAISGIGGTSFNPQAMAANLAGRIMKEADQDSSGTLSRAELETFKASKGGNGPDLEQVFATYNKSGNGQLTLGELQTSIAAAGPRAGGPGGPPPAGGPPPGGGPPPAGGGGKAESGGGSTQASSSTDARDLNGDGTVSAAELLIYSLRHPQASSPVAETKRSVDLTA